MFLTISDISASLHNEVRDLLARWSEAIILEHCATSESEVESYLSRRYHIRPELEKTGDDRHKLLLAIARDIAIYRLYHLSESIPNIRVKRYDDSIKTLDNLAKGIITMPGIPAAPDPETGTPDANAISWGGKKPRPALFV